MAFLPRIQLLIFFLVHQLAGSVKIKSDEPLKNWYLPPKVSDEPQKNHRFLQKRKRHSNSISIYIYMWKWVHDLLPARLVLHHLWMYPRSFMPEGPWRQMSCVRMEKQWACEPCGYRCFVVGAVDPLDKPLICYQLRMVAELPQVASAHLEWSRWLGSSDPCDCTLQ